MKRNKMFLAAAVAGLMTMGLVHADQHEEGEGQDDVQKLVALVHPTEGNQVYGTVEFTKVENGVKVVANIQNLEPDSTHGFHVHQYGDARSSDGTSAGGHYNPEGHEHALPEEDQRHAGDFGNLEADGDGRAHKEITVENITLNGEKNPVIGRAVVVHGQQDTGEQPSGNAGPRVAIGVIGVANPEVGGSN